MVHKSTFGATDAHCAAGKRAVRYASSRSGYSVREACFAVRSVILGRELTRRHDARVLLRPVMMHRPFPAPSSYVSVDHFLVPSVYILDTTTGQEVARDGVFVNKSYDTSRNRSR